MSANDIARLKAALRDAADQIAGLESDLGAAKARVAELEAKQAELAARASRVAVSHELFIQDHGDPGVEALGAQYELINWLARSDHHEGLPVHPIENALRIILAELNKSGAEVDPEQIRRTIAEGLPREDMSDRRRRIYIDGHGDAWIDGVVENDGSMWLFQLSNMATASSEPQASVAQRTGSLREIGRCW